MRTIYIYNGVQVARPKSLVLNDNTYVPPTDEQLKEAGYEIRQIIDPIPEPYLPTIEELVERALRSGEDGGRVYSINQEFEVQRRRDTHAQEFAEYNARVEECIAWANKQPHKEV